MSSRPTAPARRSAIPSRPRPCSRRTARAARRTVRCGSARSSRTSATPRPPRGSRASSRWSSRCSTGRSPERCTPRSPRRTSTGRPPPSASSPRPRPGSATAPPAAQASPPSASRGRTLTSSSRRLRQPNAPSRRTPRRRCRHSRCCCRRRARRRCGRRRIASASTSSRTPRSTSRRSRTRSPPPGRTSSAGRPSWPAIAKGCSRPSPRSRKAARLPPPSSARTSAPVRSSSSSPARARSGRRWRVRESIEACERALAPHVDWSLLAVLRGEPGAPSLERLDVVQPALFAVMVSLAALWRSLGVEPDAVVGHSQGEIAAACVAGALSLEDAAKVIALRARALPRLSGRGAMIAVELPAVEVEQRLERFGGRLSIAAVNSPGSTVVSGDADAAKALLAELTAAQHFARKVRVDYASHCAHIEAIADALVAPLAGIQPVPARIPLYSTVTGAKVEGSELDPSYWYRNLRQTVRFEEASRALLADGHRFFVEVSPHPVLNLALQQTVEASSLPAAVVGSLRRDEGDLGRFLLSLCELHAHGFRVDWTRVLQRGKRVPLPTYAFQRERFWLDAPRDRSEP